MAPDLPESISNGLTSMRGVEINFNPKICTGCGKCVYGSCFVNAIKIEGGKAVINEKNVVCVGDVQKLVKMGQ
jgi:ferredoxin